MIDDPKFVLDALWKVGTVVVAIYAWWSNRDKATRGAIAAVEQRVNRVEADLRQQPGRVEFDKLSDRIGMVHADLKELVGSFKGVQRAVDLMNEYHLHRSGQ